MRFSQGQSFLVPPCFAVKEPEVEVRLYTRFIHESVCFVFYANVHLTATVQPCKTKIHPWITAQRNVHSSTYLQLNLKVKVLKNLVLSLILMFFIFMFYVKLIKKVKAKEIRSEYYFSVLKSFLFLKLLSFSFFLLRVRVRVRVRVREKIPKSDPEPPLKFKKKCAPFSIVKFELCLQTQTQKWTVARTAFVRF